MKTTITLIFICLNVAIVNAQIIVADTLFVTFEPFEIRHRFPISVEEIELYALTDTIISKESIEFITSTIDSILCSPIKAKDTLFFPKVFIKAIYQGHVVFKGYFSSNKQFYVNGYRFENDLGLLEKIKENIKSYDVFISNFLKKSNKQMQKQKHGCWNLFKILFDMKK